MQLKIETTIKKSIITVELETCNFTALENKMLDQFSEPVFVLEKMYGNEFAVSINKKIRSNFKVKLKFDGTADMEKAALAANDFVEEIKDLVIEFMEEFMDKAEDIEIQPGTEYVDIDSDNDSQSSSYTSYPRPPYQPGR